MSILPSLQCIIREPRLFAPDIGTKQLPQTATQDEPKKKMKEDVRQKKKIKTTEGRKPRIIHVYECEMALQMDNQLSW